MPFSRWGSPLQPPSALLYLFFTTSKPPFNPGRPLCTPPSAPLGPKSPCANSAVFCVFAHPPIGWSVFPLGPKSSCANSAVFCVFAHPPIGWSVFPLGPKSPCANSAVFCVFAHPSIGWSVPDGAWIPSTPSMSMFLAGWPMRRVQQHSHGGEAADGECGLLVGLFTSHHCNAPFKCLEDARCLL